MARFLVLQLAAPLTSFGGEMIDGHGPTDHYPSLSMLVGLIANALGMDRSDGAAHNRLQQRLLAGAAIEPGSHVVRDFQTVEMSKSDTAWTTRGIADGRFGNAYDGPHLRFRDYHAGQRAWVAFTLQPESESPRIEAVADALDRPARPLFVGRKSCVPSCRIVTGWHEANDVLEALRVVALTRDPIHAHLWMARWPEGHGSCALSGRRNVCDERNWISGLHGGWRPVREGPLMAQEASVQ